MSGVVKIGMKFQMDRSSYIVRSIAREHSDIMIFYSLFDEDSQKVNNARVECMTQPELYKKIIENEAVIYERASDIPMQQLLTENQLNQMQLWQAFFDLHFEKHSKILLQSIMLMKPSRPLIGRVITQKNTRVARAKRR